MAKIGNQLCPKSYNVQLNPIPWWHFLVFHRSIIAPWFHLMSCIYLQQMSRAILIKWKAAVAPTHSKWLSDLMSCLNLEKIRYSTSGSGSKFYKVWGTFFTYFQKSTTLDSEEYIWTSLPFDEWELGVGSLILVLLTSCDTHLLRYCFVCGSKYGNY